MNLKLSKTSILTQARHSKDTGGCDKNKLLTLQLFFDKKYLEDGCLKDALRQIYRRSFCILFVVGLFTATIRGKSVGSLLYWQFHFIAKVFLLSNIDTTSRRQSFRFYCRHKWFQLDKVADRIWIHQKIQTKRALLGRNMSVSQSYH